jgi:hypothetical protein
MLGLPLQQRHQRTLVLIQTPLKAIEEACPQDDAFGVIRKRGMP